MVLIPRPTAHWPDPGRPEPAALPLVRVVEDEPAIVALLARMGRRGGFEVAAYPTKAAFLAAFDPARPGCIVLDLNLPDGSGIEILEQLTRGGHRTPVVFMSGMAKVSEAITAFRLGSLDFVEKPFDLQTMLAAIRRAVAADRARRAEGACLDELSRRLARLTPRETEVMDLVVEGATNREIAVRLDLSPKTIEAHRANVMRKAEAASLAELVRLHVARHAHQPPR